MMRIVCFFKWDNERGEADDVEPDNCTYRGWVNPILITERNPVSVGEMLVEEFMKPFGVTPGGVANALGVDRRTTDEICADKRSVTVDVAMMF